MAHNTTNQAQTDQADVGKNNADLLLDIFPPSGPGGDAQGHGAAEGEGDRRKKSSVIRPFILAAAIGGIAAAALYVALLSLLTGRFYFSPPPPVQAGASPSASGELWIETAPPGADVMVDGKVAGKAPLLLNGLPPGPVNVRALMAQYGVVEKQMQVPQDGTGKVLLVLKAINKSRGRLFIETIPPDAKFSILGVSYVPGIELDPEGQYVAAISREGFQSIAQQVPLAAGEDTHLYVRLSPAGDSGTHTGGSGRLFVETEPADALVRVAGHDFQQGMELPPGEYELQVAKQGLETMTAKVRITSREDMVFNAVLSDGNAP